MTGRRKPNVLATAIAVAAVTGVVCGIACLGFLYGAMGWLG